MKLLTEELKKQLPELYSQEEVEDPIVPVKFFCPWNDWTWFVIEGSMQDGGEWLLFAKVYSHMYPEGELGYILLSELEIVTGPMGLGVERDLYWEPKLLSQCK